MLIEKKEMAFLRHGEHGIISHTSLPISISQHDLDPGTFLKHNTIISQKHTG